MIQSGAFAVHRRMFHFPPSFYVCGGHLTAPLSATEAIEQLPKLPGSRFFCFYSRQSLFRHFSKLIQLYHTTPFLSTSIPNKYERIFLSPLTVSPLCGKISCRYNKILRLNTVLRHISPEKLKTSKFNCVKIAFFRKISYPIY